jgi:tetratricopeptide (TPR) repeat protein
VRTRSPRGYFGEFAARSICQARRVGARSLGLLLAASSLACLSHGISAYDVDRSMKQYELAIGLQGEGNVPGAFQALTEALKINPKNAKAHLLFGTMFLVGRDDDPTNYDREAEAHFREALKIQASPDRLSEESLASAALNGLGVLHLHQQRYDLAIEELTKAVADLFNRDAYMAWGNLGWAYYGVGNYPKAIEALGRAVRLHTHFCVGFYRLGMAQLKTRAYQDAEEAFTQAIEADERCKTFQDAFHERGEVRMNLGRRDDARADFERCVELAAKNDTGKSCARYLEATY